MKQHEKYNQLNSIHFVHPIIDVNGLRRTELHGDEAGWQIIIRTIQVAGPPPSQSGLVLAKPNGRPQQAQLMPVPFWEVTQVDPKTNRAVAVLIPLSGATERYVQRCMAEPGEDGRPVLVRMTIAEFDQRQRDAAVVRGAEAEH